MTFLIILGIVLLFLVTRGALRWGLLALALGAYGLYWINSPKVSDSNLNTLAVGVSADFPPFTFLENGKIVGFEIDLIQALGERLGYQIQLQNMPFGTLLPALQLGNLSVVAAGLTATPERAKQVLFTKPYLQDNPLVIVSLNSDPISSLNDLKSKTVVVNEGYTADLKLSGIGNLQILRLKTPAEAFLALRSGRAAAFVTARDTIQPFFSQFGSDEFFVNEISNTDESCSLAISPKHPELRDRIQQGLDELAQAGLIDQLKTKWGLA